MVAEVHRILMRGGVFMYPRDTKDANRPGRLRLHVRGQPDQPADRAGRRPRDHRPAAPARGAARHRCISAFPLILGSRNEVERIERYHAEFDSGADRPYTSPLFNERSLFRPEAHA